MSYPAQAEVFINMVRVHNAASCIEQVAEAAIWSQSGSYMATHHENYPS